MMTLKLIGVLVGVVLRERFRFCTCCSGIRAWVPMKELNEGTILKRDVLFGIPQLCKGNFQCRCCGLRREFEQRRRPPAVKRRLTYMDPHEEYSDWLRERRALENEEVKNTQVQSTFEKESI